MWTQNSDFTFFTLYNGYILSYDIEDVSCGAIHLEVQIHLLLMSIFSLDSGHMINKVSQKFYKDIFPDWKKMLLYAWKSKSVVLKVG